MIVEKQRTEENRVHFNSHNTVILHGRPTR